MGKSMKDEPRFMVLDNAHVLVVSDLPAEELNKLQGRDKEIHTFVRIMLGGMISS